MVVTSVFGVPHVYDFTPNLFSTTASHRSVLVCIHGWLLSRAYWQPLMQQLAPDIACLAYDLRGFGDSTQQLCDRCAATADYGLAAYAHDLNALLETLELEHVWLMGHSLGGSIALWAAHLFPERIQGVICVNAGGGIYIRNAFEKFRSAGQQMVGWRPQWLQHLPLLPWVFAHIMVRKTLSYQWGRQRLIDFLRADPDAAMQSLLASTTEDEVHQLPQIVSQLSQPVYFVTGEQDMVMEPRYVMHLASFHHFFHRGKPAVIKLEQCGHFAMLEQPLALETQVRQWLLG
ncbi:alpha/beta hydrolase [Leptolyngbya cf. ectocarpi LEGE 11479]|uniref:Alpha/beta hydrolase n=2 Tax=Leptolyngbya ectocarpi TaxID=1202 RepID=A0A929F5R2_LEPEC|nr:alpha/beta hydrolase [Leptolyngbya cf. ectocarpi LEGE 11479]